MNSDMSYPAWRSVFEFLEANKRIHMVARSPYLQKVDKKIPLHIQKLELDERTVELNDVTYDVYPVSGDTETSEEEEEGDEPDDPEPRTLVINTYKEKTGKIAEIPIPDDLQDKQEEANAEVKNVLFRDRSLIYVDRFSNGLGQEELSKLPAGLKFKVKGYFNTFFSPLPSLLPFIHKSSFPVKIIEANISKENLNHPFTECCSELQVIPGDRSMFPSCVADIKHKNFLVHGKCEPEEMVEMLRRYLKKEKEIGAKAKIALIHNDGPRMLHPLLDAVKGGFGAKEVEWQDTDEGSSECRCLIISYNSTSDLHVYGYHYKKLRQCARDYIILRIVPVGSTLLAPSSAY